MLRISTWFLVSDAIGQRVRRGTRPLARGQDPGLQSLPVSVQGQRLHLALSCSLLC